MTYNITYLQNSSGPLVMFQALNQNIGNWFGGIILIFVFLFLLMKFREQGMQDAFLASSFLVSVAAGFLFAVEVLAGWVLVMPITVLVIAVVMKVWGEG